MWPSLYLLPGLAFLAAAAVARKRLLLAGTLLIPSVAAAMWLALATVVSLAG
jgi:hypothetical protein